MALRPIYYNSYMTPRQILQIFHDSVVSQFPEKTWAQIKPTTYRILSMLKDEIYVSCFHVAVRSFETNLEAKVLKKWNNRRNAVAVNFWFYLWKSLKRVTISSLGVGVRAKERDGGGRGEKGIFFLPPPATFDSPQLSDFKIQHCGYAPHSEG